MSKIPIPIESFKVSSYVFSYLLNMPFTSFIRLNLFNLSTIDGFYRARLITNMGIKFFFCNLEIPI